MSRAAVRIRPVHAAIALAVVAMFAVAAFAIKGPSGSGYYAGLGCDDGPVSPGVTEEKFGEVFRWPYGDVQSCRVLGRKGNMDQGRLYYADAHELAPDEVTGDVSSAEVERLRRDVAARGELLADPWTLHYGV